MRDKISKWKNWLGQVRHDCENILLSREMFLDLHRMIEKNTKMQQSDYFHEYMIDTYIAHVTMMIRKHAKIHKDSISLAGLAKEILSNNEQAGGVIENELSTALDAFKRSSIKVEAFADRVVAHRDRRPPNYIPTYADVDESIDAMDSLTIKCALAVGENGCDTCKPTVQYGWLLIFREMGIEI